MVHRQTESTLHTGLTWVETSAVNKIVSKLSGSPKTGQVEYGTAQILQVAPPVHGRDFLHDDEGGVHSEDWLSAHPPAPCSYMVSSSFSFNSVALLHFGKLLWSSGVLLLIV